jgi:uncharacterized membrane protein YgcG
MLMSSAVGIRLPASPTRADNAEQTDILQWWQAHMSRFPRLSAMAADFCAAPATSVPSEEVFSAAGDLITKKRNRMAPETAEARMCARYWLQFPELTDDDWAEAKWKEQAHLARLEEQEARWHGQTSVTGGGTDEDHDEDADEDGNGRGDGTGAGSSGRSPGGSSGGRSPGGGSGEGLEGRRSMEHSREESSSLSEISRNE